MALDEEKRKKEEKRRVLLEIETTFVGCKRLVLRVSNIEDEGRGRVEEAAAANICPILIGNLRASFFKLIQILIHSLILQSSAVLPALASLG